MRPIVQRRRLRTHHAQIDLVNQGRALQRVVRPLGFEVVVRQTPQLFVNHGNQGMQGLFIALHPVVQQVTDVADLTGAVGHGSGW